MRIDPQVTPLTSPYWDGLKAGQLMLQRCDRCASTWHPPMPGCPDCRSADVSWFAASGLGTVSSFTWVHHATHQAFRDRIPYAVVLVDLDEGPRIVTAMADPTAVVRIGALVRAVFAHEDDGSLVLFEEIAPPGPDA